MAFFTRPARSAFEAARTCAAAGRRAGDLRFDGRENEAEDRIIRPDPLERERRAARTVDSRRVRAEEESGREDREPVLDSDPEAGVEGLAFRVERLDEHEAL